MRGHLPLLVALAATLGPVRARAVRPFLTDDARTVGGGNAQVETWAVVDEEGFEHWVTTSVGPVGPVELATGFVWGASFVGGQDLSLVGPLIAGKLLLRETRSDVPPGIAVACGVLGPHAGLSPIEHGWSGFAYLAFSQSFYEDDLLLHVNLGWALDATTGTVVPNAGAGAQGRIVGPVTIVGEIFYGDALDATNQAWTFQLGTRLLLDDAIQLDATGALVLTHGEASWFATAGVRLVAERLYPEPVVAEPPDAWNGRSIRYDAAM